MELLHAQQKLQNVGTGSRAQENKNSCLVPDVLKVKNRESVMVGIEELEPIAGFGKAKDEIAKRTQLSSSKAARSRFALEEKFLHLAPRITSSRRLRSA